MTNINKKLKLYYNEQTESIETLSYIGKILSPAAGAVEGPVTLLSNAASGDTSIKTLTTIPASGVDFWVLIAPFTAECEIKKVTSQDTGKILTLDSALSYAHAKGTVLHWLASPIINVKWFGATGDGATDDSTAIQAALDVDLGTGTGYNTVVYFPPGEYRVESSLNCTERRYFKLIGSGQDTSKIVGALTGCPVFDLRGSRWFQVEDFTVEGDSTDTPTMAFGLSRTPAGVSCGNCTFENMRLIGDYSLAGWYVAHAEVIQWVRCYVIFFDSPYAIYMATNPDTAMDGCNGINSNNDYPGGLVYTITGCSFAFDQASNGTVLRVGDRYKQIKFRDSWCAVYGTGVVIEFDTEGFTGAYEILVDGVYMEGTSDTFCTVAGLLRRFTFTNSGGAGVLMNCAENSRVRQMNASNLLTDAGDEETPFYFYNLDYSHIKGWTNYLTNNISIGNNSVGNVIDIENGNVTVSGNTTSTTVRRTYTKHGIDQFNINKQLSETTSLNFGTLPANSTASQTITMSGTVLGDNVYASPAYTTPSGLIWNSRAQEDEVVITLANILSGPVDANPGGDEDWAIDVWGHWA